MPVHHIIPKNRYLRNTILFQRTITNRVTFIDRRYMVQQKAVQRHDHTYNAKNPKDRQTVVFQKTPLPPRQKAMKQKMNHRPQDQYYDQ